jgi:pilus assembly protein Flp/PilA
MVCSQGSKKMNTVVKINHRMNTLVLQLVALVQSYLPTTLKREEGQGMVEYALIIALVAIVLIGALTTLSGGISGTFSKIVKGFGG